MKICRHF